MADPQIPLTKTPGSPPKNEPGDSSIVFDKLIKRVVFLERALRDMKKEFAWTGPLTGFTSEMVHDLLMQRIDEALKGDYERRHIGSQSS